MLKIPYFDKIKSFFVNFYNKNKKLFFISLSILVVLLVGLFSTFSKSKTKNISESKSSVSVNDYASSIESKLESILLSINSISKAEVFVMVESTPIKHFVTETETTKTGSEGSSTESKKETIVYQKNGSSSSPVEMYSQMPKISGVLVFVNKIDASTKVSIINALSVVLNIDESCISILQER